MAFVINCKGFGALQLICACAVQQYTWEMLVRGYSGSAEGVSPRASALTKGQRVGLPNVEYLCTAARNLSVPFVRLNNF